MNENLEVSYDAMFHTASLIALEVNKGQNLDAATLCEKTWEVYQQLKKAGDVPASQ